MLVVCENCGAKHRPHHMCQACGWYNGRVIIDMKAQAEKREARMQAKKEAIAGQQAEAAEQAAVADQAAAEAETAAVLPEADTTAPETTVEKAEEKKD